MSNRMDMAAPPGKPTARRAGAGAPVPVEAPAAAVAGAAQPAEKRKTRGAVSGAAVMMGSKIASLLLALVATAVVARLVTPADYGLVAMVLSVTSFLTVPSDFGLSLVTVQKAKISHEQLSTLFWVNVGFGALLGLVAVLLAPLLVRFYGDPRLWGITLLTALTFPVAALGVQHEALVRRHMEFGRLSLVRLVSTAVGAVVCIAMAWWGLGYWALIAQPLVISLVGTLGVWLCVRWLPGWPARCPELWQMLGFGGSLTAHGIAGYFANSLDKVLLGRYCGAHSLGLYANSYTLMAKALTVTGYSVGDAAIPAMSRASGDIGQMRIIFRRMLEFTVLIGLPICLISIAWANEVVRTLLGPKWQEADTLLRLLFLAALPRLVMASTGWVYIATGMPRRMLTWQLMWSPAVVAAFLIGLPWGATGVAAGYAAVCWLGLVPALAYCFRGTGFTRKDVLRPVVRPVLCSLLAWAGAGSITWIVGDDTGREILVLVLHVLVFGAIYAASTALTVPLVREGIEKARARLRGGPVVPQSGVSR